MMCAHGGASFHTESIQVMAASATVQEEISNEEREPVVEEVVETPDPATWEITLATEEELVMLAKLIRAEAGGIESDAEKAAVVWCVLNRVDAGFGDTIKEVVTARHQFAYRKSTPLEDEFLALARDVVARWEMEKAGYEDVGRVLPSEHLFFSGDGEHNHFRNAYRNGEYYDWSLPSPYPNDYTE